MGKGNGTIPNVQDNEGEGEGNPKAPLHNIREENLSKKTGHGDHDGDTYFGEAVDKRKEAIQQANIAEYRRQMNFPEEVSRTISRISEGGGDAPSASINKGSSYNRNSKRGTRLVRSR